MKPPISVSIDEELQKVTKELGVNRSAASEAGIVTAVVEALDDLNVTERNAYKKRIKHVLDEYDL